MTITICGSMQFSEEMLEVQKQMEEKGHTAYVADTTPEFVGKDAAAKEALVLEHKREADPIRDHYKLIAKSDAILVLNYDKRGIANYIGGNTLMELGFAYVLRKKIFLLNPIPDIPYYQSEIEAVKPIILHGDLSKISDQ
jgi:hypothetical protein